jgi:hypothetical protein
LLDWTVRRSRKKKKTGDKEIHSFFLFHMYFSVKLEKFKLFFTKKRGRV